MGIGPIHSIPKLLSWHGLTVDNIDLWELNEAFASQSVYIRDHQASIRRNSTSTAAPSPSDTRTA